MYSCICSVALFVFLCLSTYCLLFLPSFFFFMRVSSLVNCL